MNRADIDKHFENQEKIIAKLDELKKQAQPAKRQHVLNDVSRSRPCEDLLSARYC